MNYQAYEAHAGMMAQLRQVARTAATSVSFPWLKKYPGVRELTAGYTVLSSLEVTHARPDFEIRSINIGNHEVRVHEEVAYTASFATLLRFRKEGIDDQPRVLIVAPMSGHFATLLRETIRTMLADHEVYVTDWHNARDVPVEAGCFGLDEYAHHLITFLEVLGAGAHMVAVCQPCVSALTAVAIMAEDGHPAQPRSLTLMAGPIDARVNPTKVNQLATSKPIEWFEDNLISTVPQRHPGAQRRVYPGFVQLAAFMGMNPQRHMNAFKGLYASVIGDDLEKANTIRAFYKEYFAVSDLYAEFYLETIALVFQKYALATGKLQWRGRRVNPAAIKRTALLTIEGEHDDICAIGQTMAAHHLCKNIPPLMKLHHMQTGVGHYGVFSGRRWNQFVYPVVRKVTHAHW